jgi:DNA-binding transcriptional MerR regulator
MDKSPDAFRTIGEVAALLDTPTHVLRFWETHFPQVRPVKRAGGRRYYRPVDVALLGGIRLLLYDQGMTIRGVQKVLRDHGIRHVAALAPQAALLPGAADRPPDDGVAADRPPEDGMAGEAAPGSGAIVDAAPEPEVAADAAGPAASEPVAEDQPDLFASLRSLLSESAADSGAAAMAQDVPAAGDGSGAEEVTGAAGDEPEADDAAAVEDEPVAIVEADTPGQAVAGDVADVPPGADDAPRAQDAAGAGPGGPSQPAAPDGPDAAPEPPQGPAPADTAAPSAAVVSLGRGDGPEPLPHAVRLRRLPAGTAAGRRAELRDVHARLTRLHRHLAQLVRSRRG